jgi:hypothetical protein
MSTLLLARTQHAATTTMKLFGKKKEPPTKESLAKLRNSVSMMEKVRCVLSLFFALFFHNKIFFFFFFPARGLFAKESRWRGAEMNVAIEIKVELHFHTAGGSKEKARAEEQNWSNGCDNAMLLP